jgi:hypothetical protein
MSKFVLVYKGGQMGETPEAQKAAMEAWMNWFGALGQSVIDAGSPFGPSTSIAADGSISEGGKSSLSGYSIVTADSISEATDKAKGCPVLVSGGSVEVYEALPIG